jgi:hypothetical protein
MSSIANYFEKAVRSTRKQSSADITSMIFIILAVVTILILLTPR